MRREISFEALRNQVEEDGLRSSPDADQKFAGARSSQAPIANPRWPQEAVVETVVLVANTNQYVSNSTRVHSKAGTRHRRLARDRS